MEEVLKTAENPQKRLTLRQKKALELVEKGGKSMGAILRAAGYSAAVIKNPARVFGSVAVRMAMEAKTRTAEITEKTAFESIKEFGNAKKFYTEFFPSEKDSGLTDNKIKRIFKRSGYSVLFITSTKGGGRVAKIMYPDWRAQAKAARMIFKIFGTFTR